MLKWNLLLAASVISIGLTSCGGGGSSSTTPPPIAMVPPPPSAAPTTMVTSSATSAEEGQPITLDASGTTDSDTATTALTFTWSQATGSPATIVSPNAAITEIVAPEVSSDETVTFQLSVSDGSNTTTQDVNLDVSNILQTPRARIEFETTFFNQAVSAESKVIGNFGGDFFDEFNFLSSPMAGLPAGTNQLVNIPTLANTDETLTAPTDVENVQISDSTNAITLIAPGTASTTNLYAADEMQNRVSAFTLDAFASEFNQSRGGYEVDNPCDITNIDGTNGGVRVSRVTPAGMNSETDINIIGQRNGGFEILATEFANVSEIAGEFVSGAVTGTTTLQSVGTNESYCAIQFIGPFTLPTDIAENAPFGGVFMAIDDDAQTVDLFVDSVQLSPPSFSTEFIVGQTMNPQYERVSSTPLLPTSDAGLDIIRIERVQITRGTPGLLVLLSDGNHIGEHRAVLLSIIAAADNATTGANDLDISRTILSWNRGVPQNAALGIEADFFNRPTIVINSSTSPEAIVFERNAILNSDGNFEGPSFFELGLDVGNITLSGNLSSSLITFSPESNMFELRR